MTIHRDDLKVYVVEALNNLGGQSKIAGICKEIWRLHEQDLRESGDLFYTWQYDMRWAGQHLQNERKLIKGRGDEGWRLIN
jgi:hypothetical protein